MLLSIFNPIKKSRKEKEKNRKKIHKYKGIHIKKA
jgi:hypothetical protein